MAPLEKATFAHFDRGVKILIKQRNGNRPKKIEPKVEFYLNAGQTNLKEVVCYRTYCQVRLSSWIKPTIPRIGELIQPIRLMVKS